MLPSAIVELEEMPLTRHGKVDRRALRERGAEGEERGGGAEYEEARTETEAVVAAIFGEVLEVERVGVHDNFFELGGHSLMGVHVILRLREALSTELSLRSIFEASTVASLSSLIDEQRAKAMEEEPTLVRVEAQGNKTIDLLLLELEELPEDELHK